MILLYIGKKLIKLHLKNIEFVCEEKKSSFNI